MNRSFKSLFIAVFFITIATFSFCEEITDSEYDYYLDVPEGFIVKEHSVDGKSYLFYHKEADVFFILKLDDNDVSKKDSYTTTTKALSIALDKLYCEYDIDNFFWYKTPASIANFTTTFSNPANKKKKLFSKDKQEESKFIGWACSIQVNKYGGGQAVLSLICYTPARQEGTSSQFIISTLNSLGTSHNNKTSSIGIFTYYAYPSTQEKSFTIHFNDTDINAKIMADDEEAAKFVIDCEYKTLTMYAKSDKWEEAWKRFYRAIYRDSYTRLQGVTRQILALLVPEAKKMNAHNYFIPLNEMVLKWLQSFNYARDNKTRENNDFTALPSILQGEPSDCDSRSILAAIILNSAGIKSALFFSPTYQHAVYGVDIYTKGAKIELNNTSYLLCETTATNVKPGLIAREFNKTENWIGVEF